MERSRKIVNLAFVVVVLLTGCEERLPSGDSFSEAPGGSRSALVKAVLQGDIDVASRLLANGEDVDRKHWGITLLGHAILSRSCDSDMVQLPISHGASLDADSNEGTPLTIAATTGKQLCFDLLLKAGAKKRGATSSGESFLHSAVSGRNSNIVRWAIEAGEDVNFPNKEGATPLMTAAYLGAHEIVDVIVSAGGDVNLSDNNGNTAADYALLGGNKDIPEKLPRQ
ncbi:MAG: ankyrin repeat domain-containing protein [Woeseia sp.]|nr:ankyrin repeat domain-containing protein [Woeseia sp.]